MQVQPKLFMPLVPPPDATQATPAQFYPSLNTTVDISAPASGEGIQISIDNPEALWPDSQYCSQCKRSTVFAMAKGFVRFYPFTAALPTPDGQAMTVPPEMAGLDIGTVIQQVWFDDYRKISATVESTNHGTTHVAYVYLDKLSVRAAFTALAASMHRKALVKSWKNAGGIGTAPDTPTLRALFVDRVMNGEAAVFAPVGSPIGNAAKVTIVPQNSTSSTAVGRFTLQTYFESHQTGEIAFTNSEDALDSIFMLETASISNAYIAHPLSEASDPVTPVLFEPTFKLWNNVSRVFEVLSACPLNLLKFSDKNDKAGVSLTPTPVMADANGKISLTFSLARKDLIAFEAVLTGFSGNPAGNRIFMNSLRTEIENVGRHLDATRTNNATYLVKYRVAEGPDGYRAFYEGLRAREATESFGDDRGNAEKDDVRASRFLDRLMNRMDDFENYYAGSPPNSSPGVDSASVNILFEGDSWLSYPANTAGDDTSLFSHLDVLLAARYPGPSRHYNAFPFQHHGDRADQMFGKPTPSNADTQWRHTQDCLQEYRFDLMFLSGGGNDIAEPSFSSLTEGPWVKDYGKGAFEAFPELYDGDVFNPEKIAAQSYSQPTLDMLQRKIEASFAALLRNHPWNVYLRNKILRQQGATTLVTRDSTATVAGTLDPLLADLHMDTSALDESLMNTDAYAKATGRKIINNFRATTLTFPNRVNPGTAGDSYNKLLQAVFDEALLLLRFDGIKTALETLLIAAQAKNLTVVTHTYCYPLFKQIPTRVVGGTIHLAGPWFKPRFDEALIKSRCVRMMCLKSLIDNHVRLVLEPLKSTFGQNFHYVDVREENQDPDSWNDEMHLTALGFDVIAQKIFNELIVPHPPNFPTSLIPPP